jgi:hypothetical protein
VVWDSHDEAANERVYAAESLAVGCAFGTRGGEDTFRCLFGALRFDLASLEGQTVTRAVLRLFVERPAADTATSYAVNPFTSAWDAETLSISTVPNYWLEPQSSQAAPGEGIEVVEFDVTELVRAWVAGTLENHGLLLRDENTARPGTAVNRITSFASTGVHSGEERRPQLEIEVE